MTHEEAKRKAVERLFAAIAHMNDYEDDEIEELLDEAVTFITEGTIQAIKHNLSPASDLRVRVKTMPEVRQKGWDDAIQAAVRVCDVRIKDLGRGFITDVVEELREEIRALGG